MTPRPKADNPKSTVVTLRVDDAMLAHMRDVQEADGVPISEQVRRGIRLWLESKGVKDSAKRRGQTRRKA